MLIVSPDHGCSNEILTIVACMSVAQIFMRPVDQSKAADEAKAAFYIICLECSKTAVGYHGESRHYSCRQRYQKFILLPEYTVSLDCWNVYAGGIQAKYGKVFDCKGQSTSRDSSVFRGDKQARLGSVVRVCSNYEKFHYNCFRHTSCLVGRNLSALF